MSAAERCGTIIASKSLLKVAKSLGRPENLIAVWPTVVPISVWSLVG